MSTAHPQFDEKEAEISGSRGEETGAAGDRKQAK
jgi:hypothetical protein